MPAQIFGEVLKFNPYHDAKGRFSSANAAATFTYAPGKSKAHDLAIQREKERTSAAENDNSAKKGFHGILYHGSPATDIQEFDMNMAGKNTSSGEKLLFFTDSKQMAEDFSYERIETDSRYFQERGKKGRVYEVEVDMKRPLDFRQLSDDDIDNILKLDIDGILTREEVVDFANRNHQLLKSGLDLTATSLKSLGYDGFIANTGKGGHYSLEYAVVDSKQTKIVKSASNAKTFDDIVKSTPAAEQTEDSFSIFKTDDDKRLVFGWASVAITVDGVQLEDRQEDIIDPEDLEEAAYEYVLNFRDTGEEHISTMRKKGKLVESCVFTAEKQKAMGIPEGTLPVGWWIGFKIDDDDAWSRVKSGIYKMFSIEGRATREPVEKSVETVAKTFDEVLSIDLLCDFCYNHSKNTANQRMATGHSVAKFNPWHGSDGRFTNGPGGGAMMAPDKGGGGGSASGFGNSNTKDFAEAVVKAKESRDEDDRWRVTAHTQDELDSYYADAKFHVTPGGSTVAVAADGDIVSVCKMKGDSVRGKELMEMAVANGGTKLDSFSGNHNFYTACGFEPVSWTPFNETYAPDGWRKGVDKAEAVVFYKYKGGKVNVTLDQFLSTTKPFEGENGYDLAMEARNKSMEG